MSVQGLKFRKTSMIKMIEAGLARLTLDVGVHLDVKSGLNDDAVWMDHEQMAAVMTDLGKNALEAMPDGGTMTISVDGDEHLVTMVITDTGKGIAEQNIPLLFTPFFTTKPVGDGTGLGLPQAYAVVKAHHGEISIESNADPEKGPTGTAVRITLPRKQKFQAKEAKVILHEES